MVTNRPSYIACAPLRVRWVPVVIPTYPTCIYILFIGRRLMCPGVSAYRLYLSQSTSFTCRPVVEKDVSEVAAVFQWFSVYCGPKVHKYGTATLNLGSAMLNLGSATLNLGYAKPRLGYAKPRLGYAKPRLGYAKPRLCYAKPQLR